MREEEKLICDYMQNFVNVNWELIDKNRCEITQNKTEFIDEVKSNVDTALWVLTEVSSWGMKDERECLRNLFMSVEHNESKDFFHVIKINDKYIKLKWIKNSYEISLVEPKFKTVIYFD